MGNKRLQLDKAEILLEKFDLKKTDLRIQLVEYFLLTKKSFSQAEVIQYFESKMTSVDRVSIYRNLLQLKNIGIIHEVDSNKYVFCSHDCEKHAHVLLYCQSCEKHGEVKDHHLLTQFFDVLGDFRFLSTQRAIFLKGICQSCTKVV